VEQLRILVRTGTFRFTERTKKQLLWDVHAIIGAEKKTHAEKELFETERKNFQLPPLHHVWLDDAWDEIEILGFPLCSAFKLIASPIRRSPADCILAADLKNNTGKEISITGYLVATKPTRTKHGEPMMFGTFLDRKGFFFDTTHFPKVVARFPFRGRGCYEIKGRVDEEFGFCSITVSEMQRVDYVERFAEKPEGKAAEPAAS